MLDRLCVANYCLLLVSLVGMFAIDSDVAFFEVQKSTFLHYYNYI
jgi:hypothetical protein